MRRNAAAVIAAVFLLSCLINSAHAYAAEEIGADYIIKYKESAAGLAEDDGIPFDVVSEEEALRLERAGLLEWCEPDGEGVLLDDAVILADTDYYERYQWNLGLIGADAAFEQSYLGRGVRVGAVDSGVNPHPDLAARLLNGHNYMEDADDETDTSDRYGHGTRVAGLIAGAGENGYIGVAPMAELVPLKITDGKSVRVSAVCRAIYGGIDDYGCDVLNLSLGITDDYQSLREAIDYAEQQGVTVVAAVGNTGKDTTYYPAGYDSVIGVGSVDQNQNVSSRSNRNGSVFLTAPGVDVRSTDSLGGYTLSTGTSFAVPQVTGAAAVLMGIDGTLTAAEIRSLLAQTAIDRGAEGYDESCGYGILNVAGSVAALAGEGERPETPCAFTSASTLCNYTGADIDLIYLLAEYDESGRCLGVKRWLFTVPARGSVAIEPPDENTIFGQFICETAAMTPLAAAGKLLSQ